MEVSLKEIEKKLETLPRELRAALESDEVAQKIEKIGKEFGIKDLDRLVEICGYVFLKFLPLKDFQKEIEKGFQLEPQRAKAIKEALEKNVFKEYLPLIEEKKEVIEEKKEISLENLEKEIDKKLSLLEEKIDKKLKEKKEEKTEDKYREKIEKKDNFGLEMREKGKLKKIF